MPTPIVRTRKFRWNGVEKPCASGVGATATVRTPSLTVPLKGSPHSEVIEKTVTDTDTLSVQTIKERFITCAQSEDDSAIHSRDIMNGNT